jgi:hypothetical protein
MTLDPVIHEVESVRNEFSKVAAESEGWSDKQRHEFDAQRMKPLLAVGTQMLTALRKAREQCAAAERLLSVR